MLVATAFFLLDEGLITTSYVRNILFRCSKDNRNWQILRHILLWLPLFSPWLDFNALHAKSPASEVSQGNWQILHHKRGVCCEVLAFHISTSPLLDDQRLNSTLTVSATDWQYAISERHLDNNCDYRLGSYTSVKACPTPFKGNRDNRSCIRGGYARMQ